MKVANYDIKRALLDGVKKQQQIREFHADQ